MTGCELMYVHGSTTPDRAPDQSSELGRGQTSEVSENPLQL